MATLPTFFRRSDGGPQSPAAPGPERVRAPRDAFQLRALPLDDVYFYSKSIDNAHQGSGKHGSSKHDRG